VPLSVDLIDVARRLTDTGLDPGPGDAQRRRAVSTAYYALFHKVRGAKVRGAASNRFLGSDHEATAAYGLLYRGFDHRTMRAVCDALHAAKLSQRYQARLRRSEISQDIRDFAGLFPRLQEARLLADYDPAVEFSASDASEWIDAAQAAMAAFDRAAPDEQTDVLALLLVGARN
jgi:uncharacterized protein (UPF0332 family)